MVGRTISHYTILAKLGEGGMGVVYKAEDTKLRRTVALKFLPPALLSSEDDRRRFFHEAQASASLSHPNIATVFEIDESDRQTFIALEYVQGQSLAERIKGGPSKMSDAVSIAIQATEALQAAHELGIVHRDVKSQNIMVTPKGQVKVLDFGLAKLRGTSAVTKTGTTLGTLGYMSPEQLRGDRVDHRTDLWALGVIFYELISGRRPFQAEYEEAIAYQTLNHQPEPLTAVRTGVPMEMERIVTKLLQKDPAARYPSAADLLVDLRSLSQGMSSPAMQPSVNASAKGLSRRPWRMIVVAVLLLSGGIIGAYTFFGRTGTTSIRSLAVLPFENLSRDPDQEYFADEMTDQLITELSKVHALKVISRKSCMVFKNRQELLPVIAKTLNVEALITPTVLRSGDRVRVNAQMIRASDEEVLWSESYDRKLEGVLELQSALARAITQRISVALSPAEQSHFAKAQPVNAEAFDLVARGNFLLNSASDDASFDRTHELMKKAVALDSTYVEARVGLALTTVHRKFMGLAVPPAMFAEAERAIAKALELNPTSARAMSARGQLHWVMGDLAECIRANKKAAELDSNDGFIVTNYSWMLMIEGNYEEGVRQAKRAVDLDPLSQYVRCNYMGWLYAVRRNKDAEAQAHRILEIDSTWEAALFQLASICERENRLAEARMWWKRDVEQLSAGQVPRLKSEMRSFPESGPWRDFQRWRSAAFERAGYTEYLLWSLLLEGNKEKALGVLATCVEQRRGPVILMFYPEFDLLRDDPRFEALVAKAELPVPVYCVLPKNR